MGLFHDREVKFRMKHDILKEVNKIVNLYPEHFDSVSHFIRVAIIKLVREVETGARK